MLHHHQTINLKTFPKDQMKIMKCGGFLENFEANKTSLCHDTLHIPSLYGKVSESGWREKIQRYLKAPCTDRTTDILKWWKHHQPTYPNLSRMARNLFSIQAA